MVAFQPTNEREPTRTGHEGGAFFKSSVLLPKDGVLVLSGYGIRVSVERGHLALTDGIGRNRREGRLSRATSKLRRLVVHGHAGTISFEALRWLADAGAAFVQIDADGTVIAATAPSGLDEPRLRRAQALAATNGVGLGIARILLEQKLRGQAEVLRLLPEADDARVVIERALSRFEQVENTEQLRVLEAQAAFAYWQSWAPLRMPWARKDQARVPDHWRTFGARSSPLTASPRSAGNPANALLNYLYAILEAESRIALLSIGLDPGLGVMHADLKARDSLALDLMEAVRPHVDRYVLELLRTHTFAARDFFETRQGVCRVLPPLTHQIAEVAQRWTKKVAPHAEAIAQGFMQSSATARSQGQTIPTLLTQANRSASRGPKKETKPTSSTAGKPDLPAVCQECGSLLEERSRKYCEACFPQRMAEAVAIFATAGPTTLARLRSEGNDPTQTEVARRKLGRRTSANNQANLEWERLNGDQEMVIDFIKDILPGLQDIPLRAIMQTTGLSLRYCSQIRQGHKVPHRRHWERFLSLLETRTL